MRQQIGIEVVYGTAQRQKLLRIKVDQGTTARAAALLSGMQQYFPELDSDTVPLGIFGESVKDDYVLNENERLEMYRPLVFDPMQARRQRAAR